MASPRRAEKVVCYLVRDGRLVVFRHLDWPWEQVGIQVPAGTIEPGESPESAAVREAREETGLDRVSVVRKLGESEYDVRPYRDEVHHRHFFLLSVAGEVPDRWASGEASPADGGPAVRFECFWVPLEHGHVLQGGLGALLGRIFDDPADHERRRAPSGGSAAAGAALPPSGSREGSGPRGAPASQQGGGRQ